MRLPVYRQRLFPLFSKIDEGDDIDDGRQMKGKRSVMNIPSVDLLKALQKWGVRDVRDGGGVNSYGGGVGDDDEREDEDKVGDATTAPPFNA
eukprot:CAMPEP_0118658438 /NCGR_PEP_ID=MMETSP0785-20121206/14568_1 /TAXON_ID=91992 /ORGANISM="Bolidomonas pacifica, Strain CCMP 1866" /LENGTH=91 /DNA_ID=CAMNT_0006551455 /DNA_START=61 /DNA_END=333 /DNA_ORIENTATION=-